MINKNPIRPSGTVCLLLKICFGILNDYYNNEIVMRCDLYNTECNTYTVPTERMGLSRFTFFTHISSLRDVKRLPLECEIILQRI